MKDPLKKSNPKTSPSLPSAISSPASEGGPSPSDLPGGPTTAPSGPLVAPANPSPLPVGERVQTTLGIYGPTLSDSSVPEVLGSLWENRLRERLGMLGSVEWGLTWRRKVIPGGRSIYRLAPLGRRISVTEYTGWPTPNAIPETRGGLQGNPEKAVERREQGHALNLDDAVCLASWPTPAERDYRYPNRLTYQDRGGGKKGEQLPNIAAQLEGWPTPMSAPESEACHGQHKGGPGMTFGAGGTPLPAQAATLAGWASPSASDGDGGKGPRKGVSMTGRLPDGSKATMDLSAQSKLVLGTAGSPSAPTPKAPTAGLGALASIFVAWIMGFPASWMACAPKGHFRSSPKGK